MSTPTDILNTFLNLPPHLYLPCVLISITELFPNLHLGWWTPPNLEIPTYISRWYLRLIFSQLAVWIPILVSLAFIIDPQSTHLLTLALLASFGLRNKLLNMKLRHIIQHEPIWNIIQEGKQSVSMTDEKEFENKSILFGALLYKISGSSVGIGSASVRSSNKKPVAGKKVKNPSIVLRYEGLASKIMLSVYAALALMIHGALKEEKYRAYVALSMVVLGAMGIEGARHRHPWVDVVCRLLLVVGFVYNVCLVSEMDAMESELSWGGDGEDAVPLEGGGEEEEVLLEGVMGKE